MVEVQEFIPFIIGQEEPKPKMKFTQYNEKLPWYNPTRISQAVLQADSKLARQVMSRPERGTFKDMEYLLEGKYSRKGVFGGLLDRYFLKSDAGKSIKTRTEEAQKVISRYMEQFANKNGGNVEILGLGTGAGRELIKPIHDFKQNYGNDKVKADFIDFDREAVSFSRKLAKESGVDEDINFIMQSILDIENTPNKKYDIVTSIGLNEYFDPENNRLWVKNKVRERIKPNGVLIATNMKEHGKMTMFSMNNTGWKLDYKTIDEFTKIIREGGLDVEEAYYEPLGLHAFVVGRKN